MVTSILLLIYSVQFSAGSQEITEPERLVIKPKSINLAIETVLEFNKNNDASLLDNVYNHIDRIKTYISNNKQGPVRRNFEGKQLKSFTDFIQKVIIILNKFNDTNLEHFFRILSQEMRKYHYKGCRFNELTDNFGFRTFIASELDKFENMSAKTIRIKILKLFNKIEEKDYDKNEKYLVDLINSLYGQESLEIFQIFLMEINQDWIKKNKGLEKILRNGIRSIIFDHYSQLNHNVRLALKSNLDEYWNRYNLNSWMPSTTHKQNEIDNLTENTQCNQQLTLITKMKKHYQIKDDNKDLSKKHLTSYMTYNNKQNTTEDGKKLTFITLYPIFETNVHVPTKVEQLFVDGSRDSHTLSPEHLKESNETPNIRVKDLDEKPLLRKLKHTTRKTYEYTFKQMYVEKNLDLKYDPYAYDKLKTSKVTKRKTRRTSKKRKTKTTHRLTSHAHSSRHKIYDDRKTTERTASKHRHRPKQRPKHKPKHRQRPEIITMKPYMSIRTVKKLKYELILKKPKHSNHYLRNGSVPSKNITLKSYPMNIEKEVTPYVMLATYGNGIVLAKKNFSAADKKILEETNKDINRRGQYRKKVKGIAQPVVEYNKSILNRIKNLEHELKFVKTQLHYDNKLIKNLNKNIEKQEKIHNEFRRIIANSSPVIRNIHSKKRNGVNKKRSKDTKIKKLIDNEFSKNNNRREYNENHSIYNIHNDKDSHKYFEERMSDFGVLEPRRKKNTGNNKSIILQLYDFDKNSYRNRAQNIPDFKNNMTPVNDGFNNNTVTFKRFILDELIKYKNIKNNQYRKDFIDYNQNNLAINPDRDLLKKGQFTENEEKSRKLEPNKHIEKNNVHILNFNPNNDSHGNNVQGKHYLDEKNMNYSTKEFTKSTHDNLLSAEINKTRNQQKRFLIRKPNENSIKSEKKEVYGFNIDQKYMLDLKTYQETEKLSKSAGNKEYNASAHTEGDKTLTSSDIKINYRELQSPGSTTEIYQEINNTNIELSIEKNNEIFYKTIQKANSSMVLDTVNNVTFAHEAKVSVMTVLTTLKPIVLQETVKKVIKKLSTAPSTTTTFSVKRSAENTSGTTYGEQYQLTSNKKEKINYNGKKVNQIQDKTIKIREEIKSQSTGVELKDVINKTQTSYGTTTNRLS